ncbi:ATP-binding protein [Orenia marismortui]|uniref:ATP-binding protein n=1 Tax=Orenia marismortui TaxID=46469 RepID=UPI000367947F|nr:ATP-binding protein [Orenia marismortui]
MKSLKAPATMKNLDLMIGFIMDKVKKLDLEDKKLIFNLRLVCEEALSNIINYAYLDKDETGEVKISFDMDTQEGKLVLEIVDYGVSFNLVEYDPPKLKSSIEEQKIGGFGIHLIKTLMDEVKYKREAGRNILTLVKLIDVN